MEALRVKSYGRTGMVKAKNRSLNKTVEAIGFFIGSLFLLSGLFSLWFSIFRNKDTFFDVITNLSVSLSLVIGVVLLFSSRINENFAKRLHIVVIIFAGIITMTDGPISTEIHGEFMIILSVMTMKTYGLISKRYKFVLTGSILACFILRFLFNYDTISSDPKEFIFYSILVLFFTIFFLIILGSEESKVTEEASLICEQWTKEQVYNDIGRSVFSTFMHDYHIDHALVHLETLEEFLKEGSIEYSIEMVKELRNLLSDDSDNIARIKEKIRLSEKDKPEIINAYDVIVDRVKYYKRAYKLSDKELTSFCHQDHLHNIYVIPMDFSGILENLIKNAIEACLGIKSIKILLSIDRNSARLSVINKGKLIPWRDSDGNVPVESFRVGRTTKNGGSGWGVYSIIKRVYANNGDIVVTSRDGETEFVITFPVKKVGVFAETVQS